MEFCSCINQYQTLSFDIGCINCLRKRVINLLCHKGLKATLCVSKWKHTKNYPAGLVSLNYLCRVYVIFPVKLRIQDLFIRVTWIRRGDGKHTRAKEANPIRNRTGIQGPVRDRKSMRRVHQTGRQITGVLCRQNWVPQPYRGSDVRCCQKVNGGEETAYGSLEKAKLHADEMV